MRKYFQYIKTLFITLLFLFLFFSHPLIKRSIEAYSCGSTCRPIPGTNPADYDCDSSSPPDHINDSDKGEVLSCAPGSPPETRVCWNSQCGGPTSPPPPPPPATPTPGATCTYPSAPTLLTPLAFQNISGTTVNLSWSASDWGNCPGSLYSYRVFVDQCTHLILPTTEYGFTTNTNRNYTGTVGTSYCWTVRAVKSGGTAASYKAWPPQMFTFLALPTATATPIPPTPTPTSTVPTPSINPLCTCDTGDVCDATDCTFDKFTDVNYTSPLKCYLSSSLFPTPPTDKNTWCQRSLRTKGDADGNGVINNTDYFYYVAAVNGGQIPGAVNPDFNGDGEVGATDRTIVTRSLNL